MFGVGGVFLCRRVVVSRCQSLSRIDELLGLGCEFGRTGIVGPGLVEMFGVGARSDR